MSDVCHIGTSQDQLRHLYKTQYGYDVSPELKKFKIGDYVKYTYPDPNFGSETIIGKITDFQINAIWPIIIETAGEDKYKAPNEDMLEAVTEDDMLMYLLET